MHNQRTTSVELLEGPPTLTRSQNQRVMRKRSRASAFGLVAVSISTLPVLIDAAPSESNKSESSSNQCVDNPNYVSRFGKLRCEAYQGLNCDGFRDVITGISGAGTSDNERRNDNDSGSGSGSGNTDDVGSSDNDHITNRNTAAVIPNSLADEILLNCPKSCGVDSCEALDGYATYWDGLMKSNSYEVEETPSPAGTAAAGKTKGVMPQQKFNNGGGHDGIGTSSYSTQHHVGRGCFEGWDPTCRDDPDYLCPIGLACEAYKEYDCTTFTAVGYSDEQVADLIYHCPCSCEIDCGRWEKSGTALDKFIKAFRSNTPPSAAQVPQPTQLKDEEEEKTQVIPNHYENPASSSFAGKPKTTAESITITLESKLFELSLYPMSFSLDFQAISDLNAALDEHIIANIDDIMGADDMRRIEVNTFLLFQFLGDRSTRKRRMLAEEGVVTGDGGASVANGIEEVMFDLLHSWEDDTTDAEAEGGSNRQLASMKSLHLGIMKMIHVTVPSFGSVYDKALVPDSERIDLAVLTVFTKMHQSTNLVSKLQSANARHFAPLETVEFIGFLKKPTEPPSASPSATPSFVPSASPTEGPSLAPSVTQSDVPSAVPTEMPTTQMPSARPTSHPTLNPSDLPSDEPFGSAIFAANRRANELANQ